VYLTPDAPPQSGTSIWRDRVHGCRRRPDHPLERKRLGSDEAVAAARSVVYDHYNIEHGENRELMESVAVSAAGPALGADRELGTARRRDQDDSRPTCRRGLAAHAEPQSRGAIHKIRPAVAGRSNLVDRCG
jgi:hypothetical protein